MSRVGLEGRPTLDLVRLSYIKSVGQRPKATLLYHEALNRSFIDIIKWISSQVRASERAHLSISPLYPSSLAETHGVGSSGTTTSSPPFLFLRLCFLVVSLPSPPIAPPG